MNSLKVFYRTTQVLAVGLTIIGGIMESIYNPGALDFLNAAAAGLAVFLILRGPDIERNVRKLDGNEDV